MLFAAGFEKQYTVVTAISGSQALDVLESNSEISIVVSDMRMPKMSGIEFIKIAKEKYENLIFFILTGFDKNDEVTEAVNSGLIIEDFKKPLNANLIHASINNAIEHHKLLTKE